MCWRGGACAADRSHARSSRQSRVVYRVGVARDQRDVIVPLPAPFSDERGAIQVLVEDEIRTASLITGRAGTVRANHYHRTDWHYSYLLSGAMDYVFRPAGASTSPASVPVSAGQLIFTPAMEEHAFVFREDTEFLTLGRNSRDQQAYEDDVVRVRLYEVP